jgi:hypothetical protein
MRSLRKRKMTAWSKKQFDKVKPRIKLRAVPLVKIEELKKAEEQEFKQEVKETLNDYTHRTEGEDS